MSSVWGVEWSADSGYSSMFVWAALEFEVWVEAGFGAHDCFGLGFETQASGRRQKGAVGGVEDVCIVVNIHPDSKDSGAATELAGGLGMGMRPSFTSIEICGNPRLLTTEWAGVSTCVACRFSKEERRLKREMSCTLKEHKEFCGAGVGTLSGDGNRCTRGNSAARSSQQRAQTVAAAENGPSDHQPIAPVGRIPTLNGDPYDAALGRGSPPSVSSGRAAIPAHRWRQWLVTDNISDFQLHKYDYLQLRATHQLCTRVKELQ
ncbi:hypothetical protein B0H17DRAFT_1129466 [Mycena rosella]|uniref:Uncharacterized protein n=1 Tax=Mycena rosella TaxID=1033263 RepID=A0AAD7DST2_MYCRO|nr:hypothetical protein B0H17DRAFT_1129466 [Mycena rosella]